LNLDLVRDFFVNTPFLQMTGLNGFDCDILIELYPFGHYHS